MEGRKARRAVIQCHDRQVVVTVLEMIEEVLRTGVNVMQVGPSASLVLMAIVTPTRSGLFDNGASRLDIFICAR